MISIFSFFRISILFPIVDVSIYLPINRVGGFPFLHTLSSIIYRLFDNNHFDHCEVISHCGFRKGRGTRDQIANICWIMEKVREFQKNIYFCFIDYAKAFDSVDHNKLWKILKEMGIPDHLTYLLRNLYAGQEATVRTGHGTTD